MASPASTRIGMKDTCRDSTQHQAFSCCIRSLPIPAGHDTTYTTTSCSADTAAYTWKATDMHMPR